MDAAAWLSVNYGLTLVILTMLWQNLQHFQRQSFLTRHLNRRVRRVAAFIDPYLSITIPEYEEGRMNRSDVFNEVKAYLVGAVSSRDDVRRLNAEGTRGADGGLVFSMADGEEVADNFQGATLWWSAHCEQDADKGAGARFRDGQRRRSYQLIFHDSHRDLVRSTYLPHVRRQGRDLMAQSRQRKLFTNIPSSGYGDVRWVRLIYANYTYSLWTEVPFKHPKTFDTLAMDPAKKDEIVHDLDMFKNGKEHHRRVGKAWKRGYLLHGPPGTGKSTMVAAMANYLGYDVYDLELTSVDNNTTLRKLLIQTTNKSIIVIEDVDCSSSLTGRRGKEEEKKNGETPKNLVVGSTSESKVTLSGLLNFIDGLWSAFGEERLIVLTTNRVENLDPALIRTGRMDKHIEMSYCDFESFKSLAKMHLDVESHELFGTVEELLQEVNMVPADVGEHLTPKSIYGDASSCLADLVKALEKAKEEAANGGQGPEDEGVVAPED